MHPHCELAVKEILPAVRSIISEYYIEKGLSQKDIADKLMLTQPAVSQYLKKTRAAQTKILKDDPAVYQHIKDAAEQIIHGSKNPDIFCDTCRLIQKKGLICSHCASFGICVKNVAGYG